MRLPDFEVEQWMNDYEGKAVYNLTDTSVSPLTFKELADLEPDLLSSVVMDYGEIPGDPRLRRQILQMYQDQRQETLTLSQGCLQGNEMVLETLLEPGDHVITFVPGYAQFYDYPQTLGCTVSTLPLCPEDWSMDFEAIEAELQAHPQTRMIIVNHPSNPTGASLSLEEMHRLVHLCRAYGVYMLCDEVYKRPEAPSFSDLYEKAVVTGSLSKLYGLSGLRFGWIKGDPDVIHQITVRRDYTIISTGPLKDALALSALLHQEELLDRGQRIIRSNQQIVRDWLEDNPLFSCVMPACCTVAFLQYHKDIPSKELCQSLLRDTGIFFVPGSCFGYEGYLRLGFGQKHTDLRAVLDTLQRYVEGLD